MSDALESYRDRKVFITGNTGFKGAWLQLWMTRAGANTSGLALPADADHSHWARLGFAARQYDCDVRDAEKVRLAIREQQPDIVFHLAAQSLVRESYASPLYTWQTNVMGTANVLEACRALPKRCAVIVVTSDKCYENHGSGAAFREEDPLGGHDPYSASKAAAELVAGSYRASFATEGKDHLLIATARAGNVIGGGDWSADRLLVDVVRAHFEGRELSIRYPNATRPWQHVLEVVGAYALLGARLLDGDSSCARSWNFGPDPAANMRVLDILESLRDLWPSLRWSLPDDAVAHEAPCLSLDSTLAKTRLGWQPRWSLKQSLEKVADWYEAWYGSGSIVSQAQLEAYQAEPHT